jgi:hypothetical protein
MKCFQEKYIGIISRFKALYFVCKIAGLVPFSFIVNPEDGFETVNTNMFSNVMCSMECTDVLCVVSRHGDLMLNGGV